MSDVFFESAAYLESYWQTLPGGPDAGEFESWQYMGSTKPGGGPPQHCFRHRAHPGFEGRRIYADIYAPFGAPDGVRIVVKIRYKD